MKEQSFYRGMGFMLLSATGISFVGLFGKFGVQDLTIPALMFWRYFATSSLFFLALFFLRRLEGLFNLRHIKIQLLRALFLLLAQYCFFYYMIQSSLLNAAALLNTGPVFIAVIEWGVLRKKVGVSSWIGALISFVGALFILQPDAGIFSLMSLIGLLSGICQGASQVVFGIQREREEKAHIGLMQLFIFCSLLSLLPFLSVHTEMVSGKSWSGLDFLLILGLGAASIFNQIFRAEAYAHGTPSRLSPFFYFAVLLAGIWDWVFFGTSPNRFSIIGAALIISGGLTKIYLRNKILNRKT